MNLLEVPFIPLRTQSPPATLEEVLGQIHTLPADAIGGETLQWHAIMRLLQVIVQRTIDGPANTSTIASYLTEATSRACLKYVSEWESRFDFNHPTYPFLQFAGMQCNSRIPLSRLDPLSPAAGGPNWMLSAPKQCDAAEVIRIVLSHQLFTPGGTASPFSLGGVEYGTPGHSDTPDIQGSAAHFWAVQGSLLETLLINGWTREVVESRGQTWGRPVWELDLQAIQDIQPQDQTSYLYNLLPVARSLRLYKDGTCHASGGVKITAVSVGGFSQPTMATFTGDKTTYPLAARTDDSIWFELPAFTAPLIPTYSAKIDNGKLKESVITYRGPAYTHYHFPEAQESVIIRRIGVERDRASLLNLHDRTVAIPSSCFSSRAIPQLQVYRKAVVMGNLIQNRLNAAIISFESAFGKGENFARGDFAFWSKLEAQRIALFNWVMEDHAQMSELLSKPPAEWAKHPWGESVLRTAREVFLQICPASSPRQFQEQTRALGIIRFPLAAKARQRKASKTSKAA